MTHFQRSFLAGTAALLAFLGSIGVVHHYDDVDAKDSAPRTGDVAVKVDDGVEFTSKELGLNADFPRTPRRESHTKVVDGVDVGITIFTSETRRAGYLLGSFELPSGMTFNADKVIESTLKSIHGSIRSKANRQFRGLPAVEFVLEGDDLVIREMVVETPTRIVQLMVTSDRNPIAEYVAFRDSLEIL